MPEIWGYSSVGRAPALQAGGHEFESRYLHADFFGSAVDVLRCPVSLLTADGAEQRMHLQNIRERENRRFSSATAYKKIWLRYDKNMYLENCILKMIRHQTVNNQISYL